MIASALNVRQPLSLLIAVLGAGVMAALAFGLVLPPDYPFFGSRLYDLYAEALLHGRFDLPVRELRFEGHFTPDGTGYLYHGVGPVLTRLPFVPFLDMPTTWLAPLSIWLWAVLGNIGWHRAMLLGLEASPVGRKGIPDLMHTLLALMAWFGSPGLLLVANGTVYYEPIAMAYGLGGGFALLIVMLVVGKVSIERALVPMALLAGLVVHARPHLAIGYYAGVSLLAGYAVLRHGRQAWARAVAAMLVLGLFGGALLAINALRFNDVAMMHGSFSKGELQYGTVYWGFEDPNGARARAFVEHGQFNAGRILPNAAVYFAAPPDGVLTQGAGKAMIGVHAAMVSPFGDARIERPRGGVLFMWPLWAVMMLIGLLQPKLRRMPGAAGLAAVGVGAALLFSYPTITLRYHVDLWPLIAFPAVFGIGPMCGWLFATGRARALARGLAVALVLAGTGVTAITVGRSRGLVIETPTGWQRPWSREYCLERTALKGFSPQRARELCRDGDREPGQ